MNVGVLHWDLDSELSSMHVAMIEALGHTVVKFLATEPIPAEVELVFVHGPFGSLVPVANHLLALPSQKRPMLVLWMSEQFWNPQMPTVIGRSLSKLRSFAERQAYRTTANQGWQIKPVWSWLTDRAYRFRYYGDILWLKKTGLLSLLVMPSDWMAQFLRQGDIQSVVAHNGYTPDMGQDLQLKRDIPVLWLGKPGSRRRKELVQDIHQQLAARGVEMMRVDGEQHPYVFGSDRTRLLNRTKIVLNILRQPWDSNYMRFLLAMANGALVVSEPTYRHAPFEADTHLVVAPVTRLVDKIIYYLNHEPERAHIAAQAHKFITTELTLQQSFATVFKQVEQMSKKDLL